MVGGVRDVETTGFIERESLRANQCRLRSEDIVAARRLKSYLACVYVQNAIGRNSIDGAHTGIRDINVSLGIAHRLSRCRQQRVGGRSTEVELIYASLEKPRARRTDAGNVLDCAIGAYPAHSGIAGIGDQQSTRRIERKKLKTRKKCVCGGSAVRRVSELAGSGHGLDYAIAGDPPDPEISIVRDVETAIASDRNALAKSKSGVQSRATVA